MNKPGKYMNQEFPHIQAGFRKGKEPKFELPTSIGSYKKQENAINTGCFIDYTKALDYVDHNKLRKIL